MLVPVMCADLTIRRDPAEERLWTAFRRMDTDQDGHVTARELEAVLEKMDNGKMIDDSKHGPEHAVKVC